jgi:predicted acylesterase/phospholipase RssA
MHSSSRVRQAEHDAIVGVLSAVDLFADISQTALEELASESVRVHFVRGETLMREGDAADCMYVVVSGRLRAVLLESDGSERILREVGPGESVGEMGLISGACRAATVRAVRDSELIRISAAGFSQVVCSCPDALIEITRVIVEWLRAGYLDRRSAASTRTIGILPAGSGAPLSEFASRLEKALSHVGPVLRLDSRRFDAFLGEGAALDDIDIWDETDSTIAAWLTRQELSHRFVLYEADRDNTAWTRRCIRQADRIILVGDQSASSERSAPEAVLFGALSEAVTPLLEFVLLHPEPGQLTTGTGRWLELRPGARLHHMHLDTPAHFDRLVRFLTDRAVGLVLGGGGARGAAHIGVIRALREVGIPIDMVGGTSAGGMISALFAMGFSWEAMRDAMRRQLVDSGMFRKYTLPIVSLIAANPPDSAARQVYGDTQIEDLLTSFFCVSCNLSTGGTVVHRRGSVWRAVRATVSLPGILVPVVEKRHLLVDGGVVDNLPATIMKELCGGPVIVVNVSPDSDVMLEQDLQGFPSPAEIVWSWVNPFKKAIRVPTIMTVMNRVVVVNSLFRKEVAMRQADFLVDVPVDMYGLLDFDAMDEMLEVGYRHTVGLLESWESDGVLSEKLG